MTKLQFSQRAEGYEYFQAIIVIVIVIVIVGGAVLSP
jgi:hypothetical protein